MRARSGHLKTTSLAKIGVTNVRRCHALGVFQYLLNVRGAPVLRPDMNGHKTMFVTSIRVQIGSRVAELDRVGRFLVDADAAHALADIFTNRAIRFQAGDGLLPRRQVGLRPRFRRNAGWLVHELGTRAQSERFHCGGISL